MESKAREDKPYPSELECMVCNEEKDFVKECFVFPCGSKEKFHEICKACATSWFKKQATWVSIYLSIYLSVYLSVCLSVCLSIYLSVHLL